MISKSVLKSVLWRSSESVLAFCIFRLLCFSLQPNRRYLHHYHHYKTKSSSLWQRNHHHFGKDQNSAPPVSSLFSIALLALPPLLLLLVTAVKIKVLKLLWWSPIDQPSHHHLILSTNLKPWFLVLSNLIQQDFVAKLWSFLFVAAQALPWWNWHLLNLFIASWYSPKIEADAK